MDSVEFDDVEVTSSCAGRVSLSSSIHASPFVRWYLPPRRASSRGLSVLRYLRRLRRRRHRVPSLDRQTDDAQDLRPADGPRNGWPTAHAVGLLLRCLVCRSRPCDQSSPSACARWRCSNRPPGASPAQRRSSPRCSRSSPPTGPATRPRLSTGSCERCAGTTIRAVLDRVVPEAFGDALAEADLFFQAEMPAVQTVELRPDDATSAHVSTTCSTCWAPSSRLSASSEASSCSPGFRRSERFLVPDTGHLLMVQRPCRGQRRA